jgi:hypothetical protein
MKNCTKCKRQKRSSAFAKNTKASDGRFSWCRRCSSLHGKKYRSNPKVKAQRAQAYKKWAAANPERRRRWKRAWNKAHPRKIRQYGLRFQYSMTLDDYQKLLVSQGRACAICRTKKPGGRWGRFAVDHCHTTGKIRGLLCHRCNQGLGHFQDDAGRMRRAAKYVEVAGS